MIKIDFSNLKYKIDVSLFEIASRNIATYEKINDARIDLRLTDNEEIHVLNRRYRKMDKPTDVLAFRDKEVEFSWPGTETETFLGEIIISVEKAIAQSADNNKTPIEEVLYLFIHGFLHLLGYDHMHKEEARIMFEKNDTIFGLTIEEIQSSNKKYEIKKTR